MSVWLSFVGTRISGRGHDLDGTFTFEGEYFPEIHRVMMEKSYSGLTVQYDGQWDGQLISGKWSFWVRRVSEEQSLTLSDRGVFELWPLEHELDLDALPLALPESVPNRA